MIDGGDGGFGELEDVRSDEAGWAGGEFPLTVGGHGERVGKEGEEVKEGIRNSKFEIRNSRGEEGPHRNARPLLACKMQALPKR